MIIRPHSILDVSTLTLSEVADATVRDANVRRVVKAVRVETSVTVARLG